MNEKQLRKLDEESLKHLTEGQGPTNECICNLLYAPEDEKRGFRSSIRKAWRSSMAKIRNSRKDFKQGVNMPLNGTSASKANGWYSMKEVVKRTSDCGRKCGCDKGKFVLNHSFANIRIVTPDISSICPCDQACLPGKEQLNNNIKVTVERVQLTSDDDVRDPRQTMSEPKFVRKSSILSMDEDKYDEYEYESSREDSVDEKSDI